MRKMTFQACLGLKLVRHELFTRYYALVTFISQLPDKYRQLELFSLARHGQEAVLFTDASMTG